MTPFDHKSGNGWPTHSGPEDFRVFAHAELLAAPPWIAGVCFRPECGCHFSQTREWQIYCSETCKAAARQEFRKWGAKMALPLLVHRLGKYEKSDEAVKSVVRASRRHVAQVQSAWLEDRQRRAA
jgi:hypothetical protein